MYFDSNSTVHLCRSQYVSILCARIRITSTFISTFYHQLVLFMRYIGFRCNRKPFFIPTVIIMYNKSRGKNRNDHMWNRKRKRTLDFKKTHIFKCSHTIPTSLSFPLCFWPACATSVLSFFLWINIKPMKGCCWISRIVAIRLFEMLKNLFVLSLF